MTIKWTPEAIILVEDTSLSGVEVASRLGVSESTVSGYRRGHGIKVKGTHFRWTAGKEALLYDSTLSNREVAELLKCTANQALVRRDALGIWDYPGPIQQSKIQWPEGLGERLGIAPDKVIAAEVGCSATTIFNLREKLGIKSWRKQLSEFRKTPEGERARRAQRRYWRLGEVNTLTWEQWDFACHWFDDRCAYCGAEEFLTEDHLIAVSKGGSRTALNMIPCCSSCNSSKGTKDAQTWIYWKFGREKGQEIIGRIVAYLTEVRRLWC